MPRDPAERTSGSFALLTSEVECQGKALAIPSGNGCRIHTHVTGRNEFPLPVVVRLTTERKKQLFAAGAFLDKRYEFVLPHVGMMGN